MRSTPHCRISLLSLTLIHSKVSEQASENDNGEHVRQQLDEKLRSSPTRAWSPKQDELPAQGDLQAHFYDHYRKVAEEYDKEFLKRHDEDLNTTLIFVSSPPGFDERMLTGYQAGLFSTVASALIIDIKSQLQPGPNDETAALFRILIYETDSITFGSDIPTLPQWSGPPRAIVQVQAILSASLAISLLSAFLAMLGKQWLNRYDSADMRGSATERGQNRQRKLDGIVAWYFNYVMESLPLMHDASGCTVTFRLCAVPIPLGFQHHCRRSSLG